MKGQASAEYLVMLAIVLVVALIAVLLLSGGSQVDAATLSQSSTYWAGSAKPLSIQQWGQANDTLYLDITNQGLDHLFLRQVRVDNVTADLGEGWSWKSGGTKTISIPGLPPCDVNSYDSYRYNVTLIYDSENIPGQIERGEKPVLGYCTTL